MAGKNYASLLLDNAVSQFNRLPGVGQKTALRFVLYLLNQNTEDVQTFCTAISNLKTQIKECNICNNICDTEICEICSDKSRNSSIVCVVENIKDLLVIENTQQYFGVYHVLGNLISPMDGIGPNDLKLWNLENKIKQNQISEIILALNTTMEGDTTNYYLFKKFSKFNVPITIIARGIAFGDEIEYTDELTLGKSITNRILFENTLS